MKLGAIILLALSLYLVSANSMSTLHQYFISTFPFLVHFLFCSKKILIPEFFEKAFLM